MELYTCEHCKQTSFIPLIHQGYCFDCMKELGFICQECNSWCLNDMHIYLEDDQIKQCQYNDIDYLNTCHDCFFEAYTFCGECDTILASDSEGIYSDLVNDTLCDNCYSATICYCDNCDTESLKEETKEIYKDKIGFLNYCKECYFEVYSIFDRIKENYL